MSYQLNQESLSQLPFLLRQVSIAQKFQTEKMAMVFALLNQNTSLNLDSMTPAFPSFTSFNIDTLPTIPSMPSPKLNESHIPVKIPSSSFASIASTVSTPSISSPPSTASTVSTVSTASTVSTVSTVSTASTASTDIFTSPCQKRQSFTNKRKYQIANRQAGSYPLESLKSTYIEGKFSIIKADFISQMTSSDLKGYDTICDTCKNTYKLKYSMTKLLIEYRSKHGDEYLKIACPNCDEIMIELRQCSYDYQLNVTKLTPSRICNFISFQKSKHGIKHFCNEHRILLTQKYTHTIASASASGWTDDDETDSDATGESAYTPPVSPKSNQSNRTIDVRKLRSQCKAFLFY